MSGKLLGTLYFLLFSTVAIAQGSFAPDGAEWYHHMPYGSFHSTVSGDTMIQNTSAKVIRQEGLVKDPWHSQGFQVYGLPDIYLHDAGDTVFVYNTIFNEFTPLYVFNVQDGDTLKLPILPAQGNGYPSGNYADSLFYTVIDSVRMVLHDTSLLKTFYTRSIGVTGANYRFNWGMDTNGVYAEKLGAVNSGLFPYCVGMCIFLASENAQRPGALRCYKDNDYEIKLVVDDCDNGGITSVGNVGGAATKIMVYPNPADGKVYVTSANAQAIQIQATDITGRTVLNTANNAQVEIPTDQLPDGVYFLKITLKDGTSQTEKLVIQHH